MNNSRNFIENYQYIISCFVEELRKRYDIGKYDLKQELGIVEKKCNECDIETFLFCGKLGLEYEQIKLDNIGIEVPFHRASLVGFSCLEGFKWYLVDPTYGQFFENKRFRDYMKNNYGLFSLELLDNGYIECNLVKMLAYINGFIYSNAYIE